MDRMHILLVVFGILLSTIFAALPMSSRPVLAETDGSARFGLRPVNYDPARPETKSYFIYDVAPGQTFEDSVLVSNSGSEEGTARLYPVDAVTGQTGGVIFPLRNVERDDVGGWITIHTREVTLAPNESREVNFTVSVPDDARPGQHVGGLVAENVELARGAEAGEGAFTVLVQSRAAVAVQANLPGEPVEKLEITGVETDVQGGYQKFLIGLRNAGTVMLKPDGRLTVEGSGGEPLRRQTFELDTFLAGTEIRYPLLVEREVLDAGTYPVEVVMTYGTGGRARWDGEIEISREQIQALVYERAEQKAPVVAPTTDTSWKWISIGLFVALVGLVAALLVVRRRQDEEDEKISAGAMVIDAVEWGTAQGPDASNETSG